MSSTPWNHGTARTSGIDLLDDERLLELAAEPVREILPISRRATAIGPLVILLAFMPGLFFFPEPVLNDSSARVALQALNQSSSDRPSELTAVGPLANWLTSLCLRLDWLSPNRRLLLMSYGGSVLLTLSLFAVAWRWGTPRFALIVTLAASCHPRFLELGQSLPANSLALAFAVWAFFEVTVHDSLVDQWMSWSVVRAGFSLGVCLLVSPPVGLLVVGLLLIQETVGCRCKDSKASWFSKRWFTSWVNHFLRRLFALAMMIALVVVSIGVITSLQEGWSLESSWSRIANLLRSAADALFAREPVVSNEDRTFGTAIRGLLSLSGVLSGLVVWGIVALLGPTEPSAERDEKCRGRTWLSVWLGVALTFWWLNWSFHNGQFVTTTPWSAMLLLPLIFLAAHGAESVLNRQWGLRAVVVIAIVTVITNWAPAVSWQDVSALIEPREVWRTGLLILAAIVGGWLLRRFAQTEKANRRLLLAAVSILLLVNAVVGLSSLRTPDDDDRELTAFYAALMNEPVPEQCWLITEDADVTSSPRLMFFVQTLWPDVTVQVAKSWEAVLLRGSTIGEHDAMQPKDATSTEGSAPLRTRRASSSAGPARVILVWGTTKWTTAEGRRQGHLVTPITSAHYFDRRPLKGFRWTPSLESLK